MRYIHSNNYIHWDLKTDTILLSQNKHVRISDFGLAKEDDIANSQSKGIEAIRFMAPELFELDEQGYTNKVDVYSFGIILISIVTEKYPSNSISILRGSLPKLPPTVVQWVVELVLHVYKFRLIIAQHSMKSLKPSNRTTLIYSKKQIQ